MKIINLFIFQLFFSPYFTFRDKCHPCRCQYLRIHDSDDVNKFKWRSNKGDSYMLCCWRFVGDGDKTYEVPSAAENWIAFVDIWDQPIGRRHGIQRKSFERFTKLELLSCANCEASSIDRDVLYPHRRTLKEIYFGYNPFQFIPVGMLQYAPVLESADFKYCQISIIYKGTYADLPSLRWTQHSNNRIGIIEIGAFRNLPALEFVEFDGNKLSFVDIAAFDIKLEVYTATHTKFHGNPWFCNEDLCKFMHLAKPSTQCKEPRYLSGKPFSYAEKYIGTRALIKRYIVDEYDKSVTMACVTCSRKPLQWQKRGEEAIGAGKLPDGCKVSQTEGNLTSVMMIGQPKYEHHGNYSCYSPDCVTPDCPIPVIAVVVRIAEPKWNFTDHQGRLDEVVRYGSTGTFYVLLPFLIYSIIMAVAMSSYYIYIQMKKRAPQQQQQP